MTRRTTLAAGALWPLAAAAEPPPAPEPFAIDAIEADLRFLDEGPALHTGGPGDLALSARVADRLAKAGFRLQRQEFTAPFFEPRETKLFWQGGEVAVLAQAIVNVTGPSGVAGPLRHWRLGQDPAILNGAIALVHLPFGRHSQLLSPTIEPHLRAALAGRPVAVVLITDGPSGETLGLNAPFDAPAADVPIAVLGPVAARNAIAAASAGETARLVLHGPQSRRPTHNLIGVLERPGKPWLVISTPRTGWTRAVAERGPGIAALLAHAAWAPRAMTNHSLLFVCTGAHEYDNAGGRIFLHSNEVPEPDQVALWVHFGAGFAARAHHEVGGYRLLPLPSVDEQRFLVGSSEFLPILERAFQGQAGLERPYPTDAGAVGEAAEIIAAGYPRLFGLFGGHLRHHAESDRLAMTDPVWVRNAALGAKIAVETILATK